MSENTNDFIHEELYAVDAEMLISTPLKRHEFIVEGLLPKGLNIISGASKIGKSWLVLWLANKVANGVDVWGLKTNQCDVLYLSLEDTYERLQDRLYKLNIGAPQNLRFVLTANKIGDGLMEQLDDFVEKYPNTKFIIIDTFQMIRNPNSSAFRSGMYAGDYADVAELKHFADEKKLCILLVHHVRKMKDADDPFNEVSGSTGISGAADTNMILKRERNSNLGKLIATGRDIEYQEVTLRFNNDTHSWDFQSRKNEEELEKEAVPDFIEKVIEMIKWEKDWTGTATELLEKVGETEVCALNVTRLLARFCEDVLNQSGVYYTTKRTKSMRVIHLFDESMIVE